MSSKKNIDRLFQEKFKEFEVKPDPKVWKSIEAKLKKEEKDDRVVIFPFWIKLSGIAASLLLFLLLGNAILNNSDSNIITNVVDTKKNEEVKPNDTIKSTTRTADVNETDIKNTDVNKEESTDSSSIVLHNNKANSNQENKVSEQNNINNNAHTSSNYSKKSNNSTQQNTTSNNNLNTVNNNYKNTNVASSNSTIKKDKVTQSNNQSRTTNSTVIEDKTNTEVVVTDKNNLDKKEEEQELKPSIEDAVAEAKKTEYLIEEEETANRWTVNPNIAPVYYNSFGEGSHLNEQFNSNKKTGEVNTSYGVKVGYALNKNLTIRSGINKLNLSYDTEDVVVYQKLGDNSSSRNVNFSLSSSGQELNIISADKINVIEVSKNLNTGISQQMSYYEMPLEVEYKLLKKRIGINIISGFSTFLLDNNQLTSQLDGINTKIGEANNINDFSFSTNIGLGINYKFSNAVVFNLEPTFKYHLNAFNNTSGSFNPYIIGLYTGVSYRF